MIKFSLLNLLPPYIKNGKDFFGVNGKNAPRGSLTFKDNIGDEQNLSPKNSDNNYSENTFPPKNSGDNSPSEAINAFYIRHEKAKSRAKNTPKI